MNIADITLFLGQLTAPRADLDMEAFLSSKIAEVSLKIAASQRFLNMLKATKSALEKAPHGGLEEKGHGAGNENRTRN
ncbi:hypothetical protein OS190_09655 [Sulfitobacter sp. F26204]|uniref:hypothetical protein n=1 Tax=Sulfitobacter sp. F26204 TaxID=2996014 RepID=UPI00225E6D4A|nr:hypothetical protein [Sulfitobacter sp. F26204]MCX7559831.1 hypothetical protein [Sulfitobacter sp. F26204]